MAITAQIKNRISGLLLGQNLRAKTARGAAWLGGASAVEQVSRFGRNMLLARILAPGAFGAMAIVFSAASLIGSLSDVGLGPAVIQNPRGGQDEYLNAAWWMGLIRAAAIYALIFPAAPYIASFYGNPELSSLLRITLFGFVIEGLISPRTKLAQKEMRFGRVAIIMNGGAICGVIFTIALSLVFRNVWALSIGYCGEVAFKCVLSYVLCPGLPKFHWDRTATSELLHFSKGMFGLSFFNLVFARADVFVLGKLFSPATLGIYTMAVALIQTPTIFLINMLSQTLMPVFSHVRDENERTNRILIEVTSWCISLGLPAVVAMWLCGPSLLTIAYGSRYAVGASALTLAGGVALLNTLNSLLTSQFFAAGKPELHRRAVAASAIIMLVAVYPAAKLMGPAGGQAAALIAIATSYLLQVDRVRYVSGVSLRKYGRIFGPVCLVSAILVCAGYWLRHITVSMPPLLNIGTAAAACVVAYLLSLPIFWSIRAAVSQNMNQ